MKTQPQKPKELRSNQKLNNWAREKINQIEQDLDNQTNGDEENDDQENTEDEW